jgi:biopolymer transport protein ExbD
MSLSLDRPVAEMNTTPLIDVMLVLLIMFIVTIPVMTHAIKLDLPVNDPHPPTQHRPQVIDLEIDFDGTVVWNGTVVPRDALDGYFRHEAMSDEQPEIHVRADRRAKYGVVAQVLASAQRNRMHRIGFVNTVEFAN